MISLTASQLPRFMACSGSITMNKIESLNHDHSMRDEGIAAHWLVEQVHKGAFLAEELVDRKAENGVFITPEMVEHCSDYIEEIMKGGEIELNTSYRNDKFSIRGRCDHARLDGTTLTITDFKYGWRIIEPDNNWTLLSHAFGWLIDNSNVKVDRIVLRIFQPRAYHPKGGIREWSISSEMLWSDSWAQLENTLSNPKDNVSTSKHCYKCPSLSSCPAAQISAMNAIEVSQMSFDSEMCNEDISTMLDQMKRASEILKENLTAYSELALHKLKEGGQISNYSLVNDLTNKKWKKGMTAETLLILTGKDLTKKQLITPTQAKKAGVSEEIVETLCSRENKGTKLVRVDSSVRGLQLFGNKN